MPDAPDRLYVYIAGPYTHDPPACTNRALDAANMVMDLGHTPFVPHLSMFWDFLRPRAYEEWLTYDQQWLRKCDVLIRLTGHSPGADREAALAADLGMPVHVCAGIHDVLEALS